MSELILWRESSRRPLLCYVSTSVDGGYMRRWSLFIQEPVGDSLNDRRILHRMPRRQQHVRTCSYSNQYTVADRRVCKSTRCEVIRLLSSFEISIISTSFSDGSVASSIDEERSLLRYLPRIADA